MLIGGALIIVATLGASTPATAAPTPPRVTVIADSAFTAVVGMSGRSRS